MRPSPPRRRPVPARAPAEFEAEVIGGIELFAARELARLGVELVGAGARGSGSLRFSYPGSWNRLLDLRTVVAIHAVVATGLPRPTALLDDGVVKRITAAVGHIRSLHPSGAFASLRFGAAGADSRTVRRVRERLATATGLQDVSKGGDLLLRLRRVPSSVGAGLAPPASTSHGLSQSFPAWRAGERGRGKPRPDAGSAAAPEAGTPGLELTARISPRPLATRAWRVCNLPGALNATIAAMMAQLTDPSADDVYLNLACGSGTLLVERHGLGPARRLIGCDADPRALACAAENAAAAGLSGVELHEWDAAAVPLADRSATALVADLPFGQLVGSHRANEQLYPRVLAEAARLACPGARFVAITQQVNLFERSLANAPEAWASERVIPVHLPTNAGILKPRIYVLRRRGADAG